jgi:DNA-binding HxlR family transcriptional regulator
MADDATDYCPVFQHAVELIGRRWTASILKVLGDRSLRFGEIRSVIPGLSDRLLDSRLTELESEGIVARIESDTEIRYAATDAGRELGPIFESIGCWAAAACGDADPGRPGRRRC